MPPKSPLSSRSRFVKLILVSVSRVVSFVRTRSVGEGGLFAEHNRMQSSRTLQVTETKPCLEGVATVSMQKRLAMVYRK